MPEDSSKRFFPTDSSDDDSDSSRGSEEEEELYSEAEQSDAALRGERLPSESMLAKDGIQRCVVAGIRRNLEFAESKAVEELCISKADKFPRFARARNARLIMSGKIPQVDKHKTEHYPYCIWYPDIAAEQTYADLVKEYPDMRYQVGRACAVAGYTELYKSLDLLPDVCIAEEAQANMKSGGEIFKLIMASPTKYAVMNDYENTVELESPPVAFLNDDTAVRPGLDLKEPTKSPSLGQWSHLKTGQWSAVHWDITEDGCLRDQDRRLLIEYAPIQPEYAHLLHSPLPPDLPPINKDVLILMAAYEGNLDRYVRLRRPHLIDGEAFCAVRGIHHSAAFARFWSGELVSGLAERCSKGYYPDIYEIGNIECAINARYIMSNDLARIATAKTSLPYMIWYPHRPRWQTLREVARLQPAMKQAVAHACIVCDYRSLWDELRPDPHPVLYREAKQSPEPHYAADLEARAKDLGIVLDGKLSTDATIQARALVQDKEPTTTFLHGLAGVDLMDADEGASATRDTGFYGDGSLLAFSGAKLDLFICATEEARAVAARQVGGWMQPLDEVDDDDNEAES
ncbi:hypothetical protein KJ359_012591 [Pestalotiopsis sp. 9143b]|nr:hypothetical protein KJ359_012591 [Pestalotiopsis sp. 9143b]